MNIINSNKSTFIKETKERANFFQDVHVWPLTESFNYEGWLNNFKGEDERYIACHILDFFMYYSGKMIDKILEYVVGSSGKFFLDKFDNWEHSDFKESCFYCYIPGEIPHDTDSGYIFMRKARDILGIKDDRIISFVDLFDFLKEKNSLPIVFIDDFLGSGNQCISALEKHKRLFEEQNHIAVYTPLIANKFGYDRIQKNCSWLNVKAGHMLDSKYNLFEQECICWKSDTKLYKEGTDLILSKSRILNIPNNASVFSARGFYNQGLAIAFEHGIPDACPGIFYCCDNNWTPLMGKRYKR